MPKVSRVTVDGLDEVSRSLTQFIKTLETVPMGILLEEAPLIQEVAKSRTPIKTGKLRGSVKVRVTKDKRRPGLYAQASASSKGYDYALIQHETDWFNHPRGGEAHYVESAFTEGVERIIRRLREEVKYD